MSSGNVKPTNPTNNGNNDSTNYTIVNSSTAPDTNADIDVMSGTEHGVVLVGGAGADVKEESADARSAELTI